MDNTSPPQSPQSQLDQLTRIENLLTQQQVVVSLHPYLFIVLIVLFFITMDFWVKAIRNAIIYFHPKHHLTFWEDAIIGTILLVILIIVVNKTGFKIQMLNGGY